MAAAKSWRRVARRSDNLAGIWQSSSSSALQQQRRQLA